ncbi:hypothetical protein NQ314_014226, partial [Rhamnusium bicolor]
VINVLDKNNENHNVRYLLDSCSQAHFLTVVCAKRLKLDTSITKWHSAVSGIGPTCASVRGKTNIVISSRFNPNNSYPLEVLLVDKITEKLPSCTIYTDALSHIVDLPLADDTFDKPVKINRVIGTELFPFLLGKVKIEGPSHSPIALETNLGFVVMESAPIWSDREIINTFCTILELSLGTLASTFWELENILSQSAVNPEDLEYDQHGQFQGILWRFSENEQIVVYKLNTVTFGVKSSPYLAIHQLATDEVKHYPLSAAIVKRHFYMDDLVTSISNLEQAKILYHQLVGLLKTGCSDLINWSVNSKDLLEYIPGKKSFAKSRDFETDNLKILGLQWRPSLDILTFQINFVNRICSKRNILPMAVRLFDPLDFIAPITLFLKLSIKELWNLKGDWDESSSEYHFS